MLERSAEIKPNRKHSNYRNNEHNPQKPTHLLPLWFNVLDITEVIFNEEQF